MEIKKLKKLNKVETIKKIERIVEVSSQHSTTKNQRCKDELQEKQTGEIVERSGKA